MYVILVYDIKKTGNYSKVQRTIFNICKKYLFHIQNSVFEGNISRSQLTNLKTELNKKLRKEEDSMIIFKSRNRRWLEKEFLTNKIIENSQFI